MIYENRMEYKKRFIEWRKPCMNKDCGKLFGLFENVFIVSNPSKGFASLCETCTQKFISRGMND